MHKISVLVMPAERKGRVGAVVYTNEETGKKVQVTLESPKDALIIGQVIVHHHAHALHSDDPTPETSQHLVRTNGNLMPDLRSPQSDHQ